MWFTVKYNANYTIAQQYQHYRMSDSQKTSPNSHLTMSSWVYIVKPDSKVHGADMWLIWGRHDPGGPHVGPMNFAIWEHIGAHERTRRGVLWDFGDNWSDIAILCRYISCFYTCIDTIALCQYNAPFMSHTIVWNIKPTITINCYHRDCDKYGCDNMVELDGIITNMTAVFIISRLTMLLAPC